VRRADSSDARRALFTPTSRGGAAVDKLRGGTVEAAVTAAMESLADRDVRVAAAVLDALAAAMER